MLFRKRDQVDKEYEELRERAEREGLDFTVQFHINCLQLRGNSPYVKNVIISRGEKELFRGPSQEYTYDVPVKDMEDRTVQDVTILEDGRIVRADRMKKESYMEVFFNDVIRVPVKLKKDRFIYKVDETYTIKYFFDWDEPIDEQRLRVHYDFERPYSTNDLTVDIKQFNKAVKNYQKKWFIRDSKALLDEQGR